MAECRPAGRRYRGPGDGRHPGRSTPRPVAIDAAPDLQEAERPRESVGEQFEGGIGERAAQQMHRYGEMPAYRALLDRENITDPVELAVIGDEQTMADAVSRHAEAGADELIFALTALGSDRDEERTWALLGELSSH
ncbi:hypothetical protein [Nocardia sienata]|uniref:hypothetical protein n=1 Tax=Nocardia sienata TaxID=248552 RepID=UPI0007A3837A|nr:hypothetical protein [Nocardia sienata]